MHNLITRLLSSQLMTDEDRITALLMEDDEKEYNVFVWTVNENIIQFGYGKEGRHLSYKPEGHSDESLHVYFPYTDLTEKEAYILFRYEKNKFKKFGFTNVNKLGFSDEIVF